nr:acyloxyacyl hydrolase [Desulfoprunum benzoelyticum]
MFQFLANPCHGRCRNEELQLCRQLVERFPSGQLMIQHIFKEEVMRVNRIRLAFVVVVVCLLHMPIDGVSAPTGAYSAGMRAGDSINGEDTEQYDIFVARELPWRRQFASGWSLGSLCELSVNVLNRDEEDGLSASLSTDLVLTSPQHKVVYFAGVGVGAMEDSVLGDYDFGGPLFFLSHAGVRLPLSSIFSVAIRLSHQSNGSIYDKNPSLNLAQIELRFTF